MLRVPGRGQHHADRRVVLKIQLYLIQSAVHARLKHVHNIVLHPRQYHLGLRVAEPGVVLQHLWPVCGQHKSKENNPLELPPLRRHGVHCWLVNVLPAEPIHLGRIERAGRKRPHAAGIQPLVAVLSPLVVLGGGHDADGLTVHKRQHGHFPAGHKLLHHDPVTSGAELLIQHQRLDAVLRLFPCIAD